jgi:hypothetical protein
MGRLPVRRIVWLWLVLILAGCSRSGGGSQATARAEGVKGDTEATPKEVFEKRILPIFKSPDPSSCVQCHLAGVDLKNYILPSHEDTFVSLRDQGLIDLDRPERSKILALIQMGDAERGKSALIHRKVREAEYAAFADWIKRSAADAKLRGLPKLAAEKRAKPKRPAEVIRHARKDRVLESFTDNVWPMRFRCMSCHAEGTAENRKLVKEHGDRVAFFKADGPEATLEYLRQRKLVNADAPEKSLLLRKPLGEVKHGGGVKFVKGDQGYKAFRTFLEDFARTVADAYPDAESLPKPPPGPRLFGTEIWLKLTGTPPEWGDRLLQVSVYAWDGEKKAWEADPVATSDRVVWGKGKLWQHNLTLLAAKGSNRAKEWAKGKPSLPRGRYLIKVHVDRDGKLGKDWSAALGEGDRAGEVEVTSAWPAGYGKMTAVDAARVRK